MSFRNVKYLFTIGFIFSVLLLLAACGGNTTVETNDDSSQSGEEQPQEQQEVIEMVVGSWLASTHHVNINAFEPWIELVEEKTDGRVKVEFFTGGTLGGSTTILQDVSAGVYDFGGPMIANYHYDTEIFPVTIGELPFAFPDIETANRVMTKFIEKHASDAFKEIVYMGATALDAYALTSTAPIESFADVKDLNIRIAGSLAGDLVAGWGATPVAMPFEEIYDALQRGMIDSVLIAPTSVISQSYYEIAPYMTSIDAYTIIYLPVMNRDFYNKLPNDLQEMFEKELGPKLTELIAESYTASLNELGPNFAELTGNEVIELPAEELNKFRETVKPIWDDWVKDANERGYPGDEMMNDFREILQEEGIEVPF